MEKLWRLGLFTEDRGKTSYISYTVIEAMSY